VTTLSPDQIAALRRIREERRETFDRLDRQEAAILGIRGPVYDVSMEELKRTAKELDDRQRARA